MRFVIAAFLVSAVLSGCVLPIVNKSVDDIAFVDVEYDDWHQTKEVYRLQSGDVLEIVHPYARDLDRKITILPDGRIFMPLLGGMDAADLIPEQLSAHIETAYRDHKMKQPSVTVIPAQTNPQKIYVGGEVKKPGVYEFTGRIGVVEAIFLAGGARNTAEESEVVMLRRTLENSAMMRTVNVSGILKGGQGAMDIPLRQYDIVYVPRSTAAEIGKWVEQNITNIIPFSRSFSYSISKSK